ncbi:MAG TPA: isoleucine--tRNA ligase [Myxococcaceae bacterium]|nr:isoleucine--tRNA ligase [Myxococcaceae bacterium]
MNDAEVPAPKREYKDTLNLPRTEFPMKGNLAQLEPRLLRWWDEKRIYEKLLAKNAGGERFIYHDGPPYANGHTHAGTALNKILKDIVVKYHNAAGKLCDFVPGWDCHGLPIEQAVEKRLKQRKIDKRSLSREQFLERCREYALEFIDIQRAEFKRMGIFARWDEPYLTLSFDYEAQEIRELASFARKGSLYRQKKPVYWCLTDRTALAEAEVEYEDHTSPSVYVAFDAAGDLSKRWPKLAGKRVAFLIWTTTPWTLPANQAIAVHPRVEYAFYQLGERVICVAKDLLGRVLADLVSDSREVDPARMLATAQGAELAGLQYQHPLYDRLGPIVLGDYVTLEQGTGLVHTAPGHGQEDYEIGRANGLEVYSPIKDDGRFDETVGPRLAGQKVFDANPIIVAWLVEKGALLNSPSDKIRHSYPHCWRCHNPVIFRATHQWFISLDHGELRRQALAEIDRVQWIPRWGRDRIYGMVENRPDWCISRQRQWGVPIPMALCEACGGAVISAQMMEDVARAVEKEGAGVWYRVPVEEFLPPGTTCAECGGRKFRRETDILDVWFDSGCSFAAVAAKRPTMGLPVDLYLEGSDQHRGWFHSSLLVAVGTRGRAPFRSVLTHGFTVDGEGRKMSKSIGNIYPSEAMIHKHGAEIVRLWVASADYRDDIRLSEEILKGLAEGYRRIRNTIRYALSNLYDFDPAEHRVPTERLLALDQWAQARMGELVRRVRRAYQEYEFHLVYHPVVDFCAMDLSAMYFDILKDRLYTSRANSEKRRSAQTVLYEIARDLLRLLAPVMTFTAEEAWQLLPGDKAESVFLAGFPSNPGKPANPELLSAYDRLFEVRSETQKLLEAARRDKMIGSSLEARVHFSAEGPALELLKRFQEDLPTLLIVSQVTVSPEDAPGAQPLALAGEAWRGSKVRAAVKRALGQKCPRCWTYNEGLAAGEVCSKCTEAIGP